MFWSKAKKIEELKTFGAVVQSQFETAQTKAVQRLEEIRSLKKEIVGLTADRDAARAAVDAGVAERNQLREKLGQQLSSALADRDQFAKRVEELEDQIKGMQPLMPSGQDSDSV